MPGLCEIHFVPDCIICHPRGIGGGVVTVSGAGVEEIPAEGGASKGTPAPAPVAVPSDLEGKAAQIKAAGDALAAAISSVERVSESVEKTEQDLEQLRNLKAAAIVFRDEAQQKLLALILPKAQEPSDGMS